MHKIIVITSFQSYTIQYIYNELNWLFILGSYVHVFLKKGQKFDHLPEFHF